jgi:hypothetical protein
MPEPGQRLLQDRAIEHRLKVHIEQGVATRIVGCTCGWVVPAHEQDSETASAEHVALARITATRIINVSFDVTQDVAAALRALRDTGLFGNGDCASVAEELLRRALLDPEVIKHWRKP